MFIAIFLYEIGKLYYSGQEDIELPITRSNTVNLPEKSFSE